MMQTVKRILMAFFIAASMGAVSSYSTVVVAAENESGVKAAVEATIASLEAALEALNAQDNAVAEEKLKEARQYGKDITGDNYGMDLQRTASLVNGARAALRKGDTAKAETKLNEALVIYKTF